MTTLRDQLLADGRNRTQDALDSLRATVLKSHAELVVEAINRVLVTIELVRLEARIVNKHCPDLPAVTNDDLVNLLRLRLELIEALQAWRETN